jgi:ABC-type transport system involved in cytochrome bd biosynthesis fused ATPase/permease subunit
MRRVLTVIAEHVVPRRELGFRPEFASLSIAWQCRLLFVFSPRNIAKRVNSFVFSGGESASSQTEQQALQEICGKQRILILDEPGSSLDPETMLTVAANLREAVRGRTTLLITHDPDVFLTDFNLFIKNGVIADIGPHEALMRRNQDYFDLLNKNMKERSERARMA